ncbi:hemocytin, partial [Asbolus verrucosus]
NNLEGGKCTKDKIVKIECRTVKRHLSPADTGLDVECSPENGLICKSTTNGRSCPDFEIRVLCECEKKPICDPLKPHKEHETNCHLFYHCEVGLNDTKKLVEKTCGPSMYYNPVTMVCDWPYAVEEIKPECKGRATTIIPAIAPIQTAQLGTTEQYPEIVEPSIEEPPSKKPTPKVKPPAPAVCPNNTVKNDCAIQCDRLCLFYSNAVKQRGFCNHTGDKCESGCVKPDKNLTCPQNMMWADDNTCVELSDCLCRSHDGKPVKPGTMYRESDCKLCQCINNYYTCDESACVITTTEPEEEEEDNVILLRPALPVPEGKALGAQTSVVSPPSVKLPVSVPKPILTDTETPPEKCDEDRFIDLLQGDQALPDVVFNASSVLSSSFEPEFARFNTKAEGKSGGSWSPKYSRTSEYLEINLGHQEPIYGIKIKGNPLYDEYITSFRVFYSHDGGTFFPVFNKERLPQIFRGSIDTTTPVQHIFDTPFEAQIIRINPQTWHTSISLQVELIGCGEALSTTVLYEFITVHPLTTVTTPPMCDDPMGLNDGMMSDQQISVSSELDEDHSKSNLKINDVNTWQPLTNSPVEFIQFDFLEPRNITGVETKGGPDGWVTAFTIQYSHDSKDWNPILNKKGTEKQIFMGNFDENTTQINNFDLPINTKYFKLIPTKWHNNIQMRVEVHGCFEPYPTVEEFSTTTAIPSLCNICPDVTAEPLELQACRCSKDKWWDGENCVARTECPCIVGHISYPVGAVYKKEDCSECLCKLGGGSYCTPKQCDTCENGLRSTVTTTCKCTCQPCPDGTTLCPTSNICINSTLWCNGIRDCPDDEINCITTPKPTQPPITAVTEKLVKECPVTDCPEGYKKEMKKTRTRKFLSPMFLNNEQKKSIKTKFVSAYQGLKTARLRSGFRKVNLERPLDVNATKPPEEICPEFKCVSMKPPTAYLHTQKECPPINCPVNYIPVYDTETPASSSKECAKYTCNPAPPPDAVCNVTGLKKNCTELCLRDLVIHHQDHLVVLHPDLTVKYDDFQYTVDQTKQIGSQTQAFFISRLGNILLFVSNRYGFWIIWNKQGDVKLGVVDKLTNQVDGLCGYFNGKPEDDKRKPNGTLARTTVEFGDSWLADTSEVCETKTCPLHLQNKALEICKFKDQILEPCSKVINIDAFVSRCIETTCDCLQAAANNRTAEEECRCNALQTCVMDCLTAEPNTDLSDWRMQLDCPVTCDAPLVYHDCFQRRCEPTCQSITDPNCLMYASQAVTVLQVTLRKEKPASNPQVVEIVNYITYDESNFTVNANCVYVMSRDSLHKGNNKHKFQVLITNAPCTNNENKICVGKVTILYEGRKIHVYHDQIKSNLKLIVDGERIDDFADISKWSQVKRTSTKHLKILLTDIQVEVSVYYPSLGVSVKAPSHKYNGKLEGLCGNCDGDPLDDLRTSSGNVTEDIDEFVLSWLYDKIPGQSKEICANKHEECVPLPKESDPCNQILDYSTFGQCLRVLDPSLFLEWCKKDTCDNHPELACPAIEAYARDCANAGFCIDWRTNICSAKCPADKIYNACGTSCPKTCEGIKEKEKSCSSKPVEGCFCPEGKVLRNDTCVVEEDCDVCDEQGHRPGEEWKVDKCTTCICAGTSLLCETKQCSDGDKICQEGYQVVKIPSKDECCDKYACVPEPTAGPTCETPQPISCGSGQTTKLSKKPNGCQQFICECKPADQCEPIDKTNTSLEDGYVKEIDESGCCPEVKIICKPELCPKPKPCPQYYILKNETGTGKCCPLYICEPPKDKCIYENKYIAATSGGERPRTELEKQTVLKNANETWQDGPCHPCECVLTTIGNYQAHCGKTECPLVNASEGFFDYEFDTQPVYDKCCPDITRSACKHNNKVYKVGETWIKEDDPCTIFGCINGTNGVLKETKITNCDNNCEKGFEYVPATTESKQCCGTCKPYACLVEQKVYKDGDTWLSDDHCIHYKCVKSEGTMQVQSDITTCPALPQDYTDNFAYETISVEGKCCKEHKTIACKVNGTIFQVGETWPSPDGDKCKKITCVKNEKQEIIKQESVETCKTNCSTGWEYKESTSTCCGECVQVACVVGDDLREPEETWTSSDNCTTYTCENLSGQFMVSSNQESCPSLEDCPEENIYTKGCCKHCNITSAPQKLCAPEAIALNKTIGLIKTHHDPPRGRCVNKDPINSFMECIGSCHSSTFFDSIQGIHQNQCTCCQATKYETLVVELECEDGSVSKKNVAVPSECGCKGCAASRFTKTATKTPGFVKS